METDKDLFEYYEELPVKIRKILDRHGTDDASYDACRDLMAELEPLGYMFDYYLDAVPYGLRKYDFLPSYCTVNNYSSRLYAAEDDFHEAFQRLVRLVHEDGLAVEELHMYPNGVIIRLAGEDLYEARGTCFNGTRLSYFQARKMVKSEVDNDAH